jgi:hypothetical protein
MFLNLSLIFIIHLNICGVTYYERSDKTERCVLKGTGVQLKRSETCLLFIRKQGTYI